MKLIFDHKMRISAKLNMTDNNRMGQCFICGETFGSQTGQSEVPNNTKETFFAMVRD